MSETTQDPSPRRRTKAAAASKAPAGSKRQPKDAPRPQVLEVLPGRSIQWPDGKIRGGGPTKKEPLGYTVDADDPYIKPWHHNLRPAPEGARAVPRHEWPKVYQVQALRGGSPAVIRKGADPRQTQALGQTADLTVPTPISDEDLIGEEDLADPDLEDSEG